MSRSLPPGEGQGPYEGRGLDDLLSGTGTSFPDGLRRVAQTLDALRDAPVPAELSGEAAARAIFRQTMAPGRSTGVAARSANGTGGSRTLILAAGAAGGGAHPAPGRHRRRRPRQRGRRQVNALMGAAAAVVVVAGAVLAGTLSRSGGHPAAVGSPAGATTAAHASTSPASHSLAGSGSPEATKSAASAQQNPSGPSPTELCREYFDFFAHPGQQSYSTVKSVLDQLSALSGGASGVFSYCLHLHQPWAAPPRTGSPTGMSGYPIPGELPDQQGLPGQQRLPGQQGTGQQQGPGGNGNGNGGNGGQ